MFDCIADLVMDSVHVRSLVLSRLRSCDAAEVKVTMFAADLFCELPDDFSCPTLQVMSRLVTSSTSEAQSIFAAINTFSELGCTLVVLPYEGKSGDYLLVSSGERPTAVENRECSGSCLR